MMLTIYNAFIGSGKAFLPFILIYFLTSIVPPLSIFFLISVIEWVPENDCVLDEYEECEESGEVI